MQRASRRSSSCHQSVLYEICHRWRTACGWRGIVDGAVALAAALALWLDDPALVMALMLVL